MEYKGFRIGRNKTEYVECKFGITARKEQGKISLDGGDILASDCFKYLGSILPKDCEIDGDVSQRVKAGWMKWKSATGVLCDRTVPLKLKAKFYRTAIRPALMYGTECWATKRCHIQKMSVAEMRMLRWMSGNTMRDKVRNEIIRKKLGVAPIEDKMRENRLRWFGHVKRRPRDAPIRKIEGWSNNESARGRGRPHTTWIRVIQTDMRMLDLHESMTDDRTKWRESIHVVDTD